MINDSTNVRVIADNIKKLEKMVKEAGSELPTPGAGDTGKILKVGSDGYELAAEYSYTPPAFSSTSGVNTGQKWIDGKDIYQAVFSGVVPASGEPAVGFDLDFDTIIEIEGTTENSTNHSIYDADHYLTVAASPSAKKILLSGSQYAGNNFTIIIRYTIPDPPSKSLDEPEETTKKKTTKKG